MRAGNRVRIGSSRLPAPAPSSSRAALCALLGMLLGPLPGLPPPAVLCDRAPDPGLFGPGSATWLIVREPLLLLGGGRALLLQIAHPLVAQGVVDHSAYHTRPFDRLLETVRWLVLVTFGTTSEAEAAVARLAEVHRPVRGSLAQGNATAHVAAETPYDAADPTLDRWVLATILDSLLSGYETLIGPLDRTTQDRFVGEWRRLGACFGVTAGDWWHSARELRAYISMEIAAGVVLPVPASQLAAGPVLHPPLPWRGARPVASLLAFLTAGLLPAPLRRGYELQWSGGQRAIHALLCTVVRTLHAVLPRRLRRSPLYDAALSRSSGPGSNARRGGA
jgi:uncharacterized protein (DUF2236 family)